MAVSVENSDVVVPTPPVDEPKFISYGFRCWKRKGAAFVTKLRILLAASVIVGTLAGRVRAQNSGALSAHEISSDTGTVIVDGLADKGGQVFNVKAYGIPSDGSADASAGISSLITTAGGGQEIFFPKGTYLLNSGVTVTLPVKVVCQPGAIFKYTSTNGAAFAFAYGGGNNQAGIFNCQLQGPGSTTSTTAIAVGSGRQGTAWTQINNVQIGVHAKASLGFGKGIAVNTTDTASSMEGPQIWNPQIYGCGTGIDVSGDENTTIFGGSISENRTGLLTGTNAWEVNDYGTSFDSNTTYAIDVEGSHVDASFFGAHIEDNTSNAWTNYIKIGAGYSTVNFHGGDMLFDANSGSQNDAVNVSGTYSMFNVFGTKFYSHGATVASIVNFSANGSGGMLETFDASPRGFTNSYRLSAPNTGYSHVLYIPIDQTGAVQTVQTENMNIFAHRGSIISGGSLSIGNLSTHIGWTQGTAAPSGSCRAGSLYSNVNGASGTTLYACVAGAWVDVK